MILEGTPLLIDRIAADRPFCSEKHKKHGMDVQVIADPHGRWARPGQWRLLRKLRRSTTRITDTVKAALALHLDTAG